MIWYTKEDDMNSFERSWPQPPRFSPLEAAKAAHQSVIGGLVVDTPPHPALGNIVGPAAVLSNVPPPYQPVSVRHLDSQSSSEEPQDYLWLVNCESKKPEPNRWVFLFTCVRLHILCVGVQFCDIGFSLYIFPDYSFILFYFFVYFFCVATPVLLSRVWCVAQCSFTLHWRATGSICS